MNDRNESSLREAPAAQPRFASQAWWRANLPTYKAVRARLQSDFPVIFDSQQPLPLKVGINADLIAHYADQIEPADIQAFLMFWTNRIEYVKAVSGANYRFDLSHGPHENLETHRVHAISRVKRRLAKAEAANG
jgi:ProP effector